MTMTCSFQTRRSNCGRCRNAVNGRTDLIYETRRGRPLIRRYWRLFEYRSLNRWSWWSKRVHDASSRTHTRTTSILYRSTVTAPPICRPTTFVSTCGTRKITSRVSVSFVSVVKIIDVLFCSSGPPRPPHRSRHVIITYQSLLWGHIPLNLCAPWPRNDLLVKSL